MKVKMNSIIAMLLVLLSVMIVTINCNPIEILSELNDDSDRMLLSKIVEYLTGDYSESEDSAMTYADLIQSRGGTARQERCRLPMKRGLCRAMIPRWRYEFAY